MNDRTAGLTLSDLRQIREILLDPMLKVMDGRFATFERQLADLREDYRDGLAEQGRLQDRALEELRAIMRTIQDPETGAVTRNHLALMLANVDHDRQVIRTTVEDNRQACLRERNEIDQRASEIHDTIWQAIDKNHETLSSEFGKRDSQYEKSWWHRVQNLGLIISVVSAMLAVLSAFHIIHP